MHYKISHLNARRAKHATCQRYRISPVASTNHQSVRMLALTVRSLSAAYNCAIAAVAASTAKRLLSEFKYGFTLRSFRLNVGTPCFSRLVDSAEAMTFRNVSR